MRNVLTSLAIYDDAIKEEILMKMKKENKEIKTEKEYKQRIFIISENVDIKEMTEISLQMYDKLGERSYFTWDNKLRIVVEYKHENKKLPISTDKINCGMWWVDQKKEYKNGILVLERKDKIDQYNLIDKKEWNTQIKENGKNSEENRRENWRNKLNTILDYKKENEKLPNTNDKDNNGIWINTQFNLYKKGEMINERKKEFDKYNLIDKKEWKTHIKEEGKNSEENRDKNWIDKLKIVLNYKKENKTKPTRSQSGGEWLNTQYKYYRNGTMPSMRKKIFDENDLIDKKEWNTLVNKKQDIKELDEKWNNQLNIVLKYKNKNNTDPVKSNNEHGGGWLSHQREYYRKGTMDKNRKEIFDKYDFISKKEWNTKTEQKGKNTKENRDTNWNEKLKIVLNYVKNNKKNPAFRDKKNCGGWLSDQMTHYRRGTMTLNRREEFDKHNLIDKKQWKINKKDG